MNCKACVVSLAQYCFLMSECPSVLQCVPVIRNSTGHTKSPFVFIVSCETLAVVQLDLGLTELPG